MCTVDCVWGEWREGDCSKECGGGIQINTREKIPEHLFGGKECEGTDQLVEACDMEPCQGIKSNLYN